MTVEEVGSWDRGGMAHKAQNISWVALYRESLLTVGLHV